jgi:lysophospholipase L1-like esterase
MVSAWILICAEFFLRAISSVISVYNIEMLKYAKSLKVENKNPEISHAHKVNSSAHLMGVEINLNSLGHRSNELNSSKGKNEKRIFVLGDSIGLGWGVPRANVFSDILEKRLNDEKGQQTGLHFKTVNAGVGNFNAFYKVELFKEQMMVVDPDLVILQYFINDAEKNPRKRGNYFLRHSFLFASSHYYFSIFLKERKTLVEHYTQIYKNGGEDWGNAKMALEELKTICKNKQIPLIALLVPDLHYLSSDNPLIPIYKIIKRMFDEIQIPIIDTFPAMHAEFSANPRKAWVSHDDPHPNEKVHQIISDLLFNFIDQRKLYQLKN